ncbi:Hypothetical predicted protein [Mytilus galloprovincialis]|uniref:Uncharacterized protein n=1 Tax=Mytilus galloprovincialis TaxID=29158 RepID=A0A8B6DTZ5_MYTGA|nr:Hypothetical predicted protein [Mytilus galloprovincialis]
MPAIIATTVDQLPYKMVIHAIVEMSGIRVHQSSFVEERIIESLTRANIHSYSSVAIPGLFSAIEMHLADSTEFLIIDAVRKYFEISGNSSVKDIYFCDINEKKLDKLQTTLPSVYSPKRIRQLQDADIYDKQYEKTGNKEVIQFAIGDITKRKAS